MPSQICYACVDENAEPCVFDGAEKLEEHKQDHHPELSYAELARCPVCPVTFRSVALLDEHIGRDHEDLATKIKRVRQRFECSYCLDDVFPSPEAAQRHARSRHRHELLRCPPCELSFDHVYLHERHLLDTHAITLTYACNKENCDFGSADLFDLHEHVSCVHKQQSNHFTGTHATRETQGPEASIACVVCGARFRRGEDKIRHSFEQHEMCLLIRCNLCDNYQVLNEMDSAVQHGVEAHGRVNDIDAIFSVWLFRAPRPKDCRRCSRHFGRTDQLAKHLLREHDQLLAFACRLCGIEVHDDPDGLLRHVTTAHLTESLEDDRYRRDGVYDVLVCSTDTRARCLVPTCRRKFKDENDGFYHYFEEHADDAYSLYRCAWCQKQGRGRMFTTQVSLGRHVQYCYYGLGSRGRIYKLYIRPNLRCCKLSIVDVPAEAPARHDSGNSSN